MNPINKEEKEAIRQMWVDGDDTQTIADTFGIKRTALYQRCKNWGFPTRYPNRKNSERN